MQEKLYATIEQFFQVPFLDTALKIVRLLSALVWLGVGGVTLWGTWVTFRELGPYLETLTGMVPSADSPRAPFTLPGGASLQDLPGLLRPTPKSGR